MALDFWFGGADKKEREEFEQIVAFYNLVMRKNYD